MPLDARAIHACLKTAAWVAVTIASLFLMAPLVVQTQEIKVREDLRMVAPALENYTQARLFGEVWKRSELSPRDRSVVTVSVLIARGQTAELPFNFHLALDNGVKPAEISEIISHLAFYSGWGNAPVGATRRRPSRWQEMSLPHARLEPTSFQPLRPRSCHSTRRPSGSDRRGGSPSREGTNRQGAA